MVQQEFMNTAEVAEFSKLSKSFLEKARLEGRGPAPIKIGRRVLYRTADVRNWLESHRTSEIAA